MRRMFQSATLKLTASYLLIIIVISFIFSFMIFEVSTREVSSRLERLQIRIEGSNDTLTLPGPVTLNDVRMNQTQQARNNIFFGLLYMNLAVIGLGGIGSYIMARRTLQPIEEAHEAQSRFTSDASHELRTPLAVMKSEIQVALRDKKISNAEMKELLESNLEEVDKLSELTHMLLRLSRLEYSAIKRNDRLNLNEIIRDTAASFNVPPDRFKLNLPEPAIVADGNEPMINDLLRILFENALQYSPADTPVLVTLSSTGRTYKIEVANEGEGISAKDLPFVFDRFFRADRSRSTQEIKGYGLGLSLAHKIVELHDGEITAQSTPNEITRFSVVLPRIRKNR